MCGVCDCCNRLIEGKVGWVWQSWLCAAGDIFVEGFPSVGGEASTEVAACVKVLIASGLPSDSSLPNSSIVKAPITINIPNGLSSRAPLENSEATCSMQGTNITIPVFVQKMPLLVATPTPAEVLDGNGPASGNFPPRRKRKPWSEVEDKELIVAVQKCGEGNWANILKGDFKGDRTASQLSQRWNIIRKKKGNLNVESNSTGSQLFEARRAAHHAMSLAVDMLVKNLTSTRPVPPRPFKKIYAFGDSFIDTSNTKSATGLTSFGHVSNPPYGTTFFHHPTNRYSEWKACD
ncbi:hypothetical protein SO802_020236 [Lithocarpus litseifolius]|uniref:Uncharacterized protein n=1 Tax=Lithocarpus litseifolius TaxID=425828 RepID=A0AAW2CGP0_9ROSI